MSPELALSAIVQSKWYDIFPNFRYDKLKVLPWDKGTAYILEYGGIRFYVLHSELESGLCVST